MEGARAIYSENQRVRTGEAETFVGTTRREPPKFAQLQSRHFVEQQSEKQLLRGASIRLGPLVTVFGCLLEQGAVLGRAFRDSPVPFLTAYYADADKAERALEAMSRSAVDELRPLVVGSGAIVELIVRMEMKTTGDDGEWGDWLKKRGDTRVPMDAAMKVAWVYAVRGAELGLVCPREFEEIFRKTYRPRDPSKWKEMFKYGVVDGPAQPDITIEGAEEDARACFRDHCARHLPHLLADLGY